MKTMVGFARKSALSPGAHRSNDAAILRATIARLEALGWSGPIMDESQVEAGDAIPPADLYLDMCQGREANVRLLALEQAGARFVNRPSSALRCHRVPLVEAFSGSGVAFAESWVVREGDPEAWLRAWIDSGREPGARLWLKRGDVHAEGPDDVVAVPGAEVGRGLSRFFARSIRTVVAQRHLGGPLVKFYGVGDRWFRAFSPAGEPAHAMSDAEVCVLSEVALDAARLLGLEVFGGDAILVAPGRPVLIDVNDWPSFARFRAEAAAAIALHVDGGQPRDAARRISDGREEHVR